MDSHSDAHGASPAPSATDAVNKRSFAQMNESEPEALHNPVDAPHGSMPLLNPTATTVVANSDPCMRTWPRDDFGHGLVTVPEAIQSPVSVSVSSEDQANLLSLFDQMLRNTTSPRRLQHVSSSNFSSGFNALVHSFNDQVLKPAGIPSYEPQLVFLMYKSAVYEHLLGTKHPVHNHDRAPFLNRPYDMLPAQLAAILEMVCMAIGYRGRLVICRAAFPGADKHELAVVSYDVNEYNLTVFIHLSGEDLLTGICHYSAFASEPAPLKPCSPNVAVDEGAVLAHASKPKIGRKIAQRATLRHLRLPRDQYQAFPHALFGYRGLIKDTAKSHAIVTGGEDVIPLLQDFSEVMGNGVRTVMWTPGDDLQCGAWALSGSFNSQVLAPQGLALTSVPETQDIIGSAPYWDCFSKKSPALVDHLEVPMGEPANYIVEALSVALEVAAELRGLTCKLAVCCADFPGSEQHSLREALDEPDRVAQYTAHIHHNGARNAGHYSAIMRSEEIEAFLAPFHASQESDQVETG